MAMRAIDIKGGSGHREALFINEKIPKPQAKECQALVKVKAFGVNYMDIIQREGGYPVPPQAPATLGVEFSGTIDTLGENASGGFKVGDEVLGLAYGGAYAEYVVVNTKMLLHKPSGMSFEEAAAIPETWITATQALRLVGEFSEGKKVLWHAGASGVSVAGIQLSKLGGASAVYATAGSDEKCDFIVKELGATAAFNYKTGDWAAKVKEATGGAGVDLIVDFIAGDYVSKNIDVAARDARIVLLSTLGGAVVNNIDMSKVLYKRLRIEGTTLRSRDESYQGKLRDLLEEVLPSFGTGQLKVVIHKVLPWEDIQEAHKMLEEKSTQGKVVLTIS